MRFSFFGKLADLIRPKPALETPSKPDDRVMAVRNLRDRWSTYPTTGLTPASLAAVIRDGDMGSMAAMAEMFEEMEERDAHLSSVLQTRKLSVLGLDRVIMPYSTADDAEGRRSQEIAAFVEHAIESISNFDQAIFNLLDAIGKGYSVIEINWTVGNQVLVDSLDWIHPKRITFTDSLEPRIITDQEPIKGEEFPPWKVIYWCYKARSGWDNRAGLLRVVSLLFMIKNYSLKDWSSYNEVFGMPLRLGKYDPTASQSDRDALYQAVKALGSDAAGIISKTTEIEFVQAANGTGSDNPFLALLQFCNNEMSKAVLGQTLTTDTSGATGTYSAGRVHATVRQDLLEADGNALADVITKQLIFPLVGFNYGWDAARTICPYLRLSIRRAEDLHLLSQTYKNLIDAGVPISLSHINEKFELPELQEGVRYVAGGRVAKYSESDSEIDSGKSTGAESYRSSQQDYDATIKRRQAKIDKIASDAITRANKLSKMMLRPVENLIREGRSLEEIRDGLTKVYGDINTRQMEELLYQSLMLSYFLGYEND